VYIAECSSGSNYYAQMDNFRVGRYAQIYPKLTLIEDATTWLPG